MKNTDSLASRFSIALASACVFAIAAGSPALAQDKGKAAPAKGAEKAAAKDERGRKVMLENDKVIAAEVRYAPGSSSGMLERGNRVVRAMSDGTLEKTYPDGRKETVTWKTGEVRYNPKETYSQRNTGKTEVVLYSITLKDPKK